MKREETERLASLSRQELKELEAKEKTVFQSVLDWIIMVLPIICGVIAILEYKMIPDKITNNNPNTYVGALWVFIGIYFLYFLVALIKKMRGNLQTIEKLRFKAPLMAVIFLLLAGYDYLTVKTGILTQPFIPCMNAILNIAWADKAYLIECTLHTLRLLFLGYFIGVAAGLVTGIVCGYSEKVRYWINPIIKFLGPIPTPTWIPIIMVVFTSLFKGAVFIIALGSWFAVTVAEMMGVKAGLGWYMNWAKSWAAYDKMFAALFVICIIFTVVTKGLDIIKRRLLRWQNGVVK